MPVGAARQTAGVRTPIPGTRSRHGAWSWACGVRAYTKTFASTITAAPSGIAWSGRGMGVRQGDQRVGERLVEVRDNHISEQGGQAMHRSERFIRLL
jgi:hypothetical protein